MKEWIATVGSISTIVDERDITYAVGDSEVSSQGMTALHYAAFYSNSDIVKILLDAGAGMYCRVKNLQPSIIQ